MEQHWQDYADQVFARAYRLTGNRQDAEDLMQETFVRALGAQDQFDGVNPGGWLHRITQNLFLDRMRRSARITMDAFFDGDTDRLVAEIQAPDDAIDVWDADIEQALKELPEKFRKPLVLSDVHGWSHDEIAAALDIKIGTVRSRIHRGRKRLRLALAHREPTTDRARVLGPLPV